MEERVQCAECGNQYDSNENAFCPRCGSVPRTRNVGEPLKVLLVRADPSLRRLRAAGLVLMILGAMAAAQFLYLAVIAPGPDEAFLDDMSSLEPFASQPGGHLSLFVHNGTGTDPILVTATAPNGTVLAESVLDGGSGWFNRTLQTTFSNITVTSGNTSVLLRVYLPAGNDLEDRVDLGSADGGDGGAGGADADAGAGADARWLVADTRAVVRILSGFAIFLSLVVVMGGLGAWRQRTRGLAVLAGVLAVFPGLIVLPFQLAAGFLLLLPGAIALVFIVAGRRHFVRKN